MGSKSCDKTRKRRSSPQPHLSLEVAHRITQTAKQKYSQVEKTKKAYAAHVDRAQKWHVVFSANKDISGVERAATSVANRNVNGGDQPTTNITEEMYRDPAFRHAFNSIPNCWSNKVLAIYLSCRVFVEGRSLSTAQGIYAALKAFWNNA